LRKQQCNNFIQVITKQFAMNIYLHVKHCFILSAMMFHLNIFAQLFSLGNVNGSGAGSQEVIEMRLRAFRKPSQSATGDKEFWLGVADMGSTASNRVYENDLNWGFSTNGEWFFSLTYNPIANTLTSIMSKTSGGSFSLPNTISNYAVFATGTPTPGKTMTAINNLNYMKLRLRNANSSSSTTLDNLVLNGTSLNGSSIVANSAGADIYSNVTSFNFASTWTLTGKLTLAATGNYNNSAEGNSFTIIVGYSVIPIPLQWGNIGISSTTNNLHTLHWETLQEFNVHYFDIEGSNDGIRFNTIAQKQAVGNTAFKQYYKVTLNTNYKYYRIKQVDVNNRYTYSEIITISTSSDIVKPQLIRNVINNNMLAIQSPSDKNTITVLTALGNTLFTATTTGNRFNLMLPATLHKGYYVARVVPNNDYAHAINLPFLLDK
jgi:hypothetical protein